MIRLIFKTYFMRKIVLTLTLFCIWNTYAQTIKVQPYPQDVTTSSAYILWETNNFTESTVEWGTSTALGNSNSGTSFNATDTNYKMHEVQLTGLSPATKYYYRVKTGSAISPIYNFKTNPTPDSEASFTFVAVSDMQVDNANPNKFYEICHDGVLDYYQTTYGGDISDHLGLILTPGDLVMSGSTYSQWEQTYFTPAQGLNQYVGNYPILGNHEINSPNYFNYFRLPTNGPSGYNEHTWYKDYSNVRFIGMDSNFEVANYQTVAQLDWLTTTLNDAAANTHIDFVVLQIHHPYKSELWTPGEVAYTGQVIYRMEQFTNTSGKPSMHLFGHTHGYSRGQSKDYKHMMVDVATAGGNIDYWGEYPNADYPQFSNTQDEYGFVVFEVTAGSDPKITLKRFSRGDESTPKDNVLTDTFTIYKNSKVVNTPTPEFPIDQTIFLECVEFRASDFSSPESGSEHGQTQWQVNPTNDFADPQFDSWKNFENWYYNTNTQATDDLTDETILGLQANTTYWWRVRYRDKEMNWSEWSNPVSFATGSSAYTPNLLQNPGAESGMTNWSIEEGSVESLTNAQCGGPAPYAGSKLFAVGGICTDTPIGRATQTVDVSTYASLIDTGNYQADFGAYMRDWESMDIPQVKIYFYNASNSLLGSSNWLSHNTPSWTLKEDFINIPISTRLIKYEMKGVRNNGSDNDSYMDDTFLRLGSETIDCSGLSIQDSLNSKFKLFPNPMSNSTQISFDSNAVKPTQLNLVNILGESIQVTYFIQNDRIVLEKNNIPSGIYMVSIYKDQDLLWNSKLIIN
jgi:hypothetical protein